MDDKTKKELQSAAFERLVQSSKRKKRCSKYRFNESSRLL